MKILVLIFLALVADRWTCRASNSEENDLLLDLDDDTCSLMVCRAGRECRVDANGEGRCSCVQSCPDHFVPVCGSNGQSYDNFCSMHRDACLTGVHISLKHKGYCSKKSSSRKSSRTKSKNSKRTDEDSLFEPIVCFQWERDALRRQMLAHFSQHTTDQSWYRPDLKASEKIWARFYTCDSSGDDFLDANEFLDCLKQVPFSLRTTATNNDLVKALCVDAIVDSADADSDWRLDYEEFKMLVADDFHPKEKLCSLEGKKYEDGSQTKVDCNDCVCACGSWVCSSSACDQANDIDEISDSSLADDKDDILGDEDLLPEEEDEETLASKLLDIEEDDNKFDPDEDDIVSKGDDFEYADEDYADEDEAEVDDEDDDNDEEDKKVKPKEKKSKKSKSKKKKTARYSDDI